jgi:DNA repair photolyase
MRDFQNPHADMPRRKGRATSDNPANTFERLHVTLDPAALEEDELRQIPTELFRDDTKNIFSINNSPDIPFTHSINPYRGCEHGCIYCYARPSHEYLGFSAGLDFESRIVVKPDAPRLLYEAFRKRSYVPTTIVLSGNTDPYQPLERKFRITRGILEVCLSHRNPVSIITKNHLVTRDLDLLEGLAAYNCAHVTVSITSLRPEITGKMEPRTSRPVLRLKTVQELTERGIPVGVNVAPIIPGLTDDEMPAILKEAAAHGAMYAGYTIVRLPGAVEGLFKNWMQQTFPDRAKKILDRLHSLRGDDLGGKRFGRRMGGEGVWANLIHELFHSTCRRYGLNKEHHPLETRHFRHVKPGQKELF